MRLHEPIAGFNPHPYPQGDVTQYFGTNPVLYARCCGLKGHNGWDIVRAHGTPILCVESGKVVEVNDYPDVNNGKFVRVLCESGEWVYLHLSKVEVKLGQIIAAGHQIGLMGNTGFVVSDRTAGGYWKYNPYAGTHLHLTHYPGKIWRGEKRWNKSYPTGDRLIVAELDNGYGGAVDFKAEDFGLKTPVSEQLPSDRAALLAAQYRAHGDIKMAALMGAIVQLLKTWGK